MTAISDLSWDLVEKILSRVPIISIGAVRSTCKRWNRLSKVRVLCKAEAKRHQFLRFMLKNYKLCSMRFDLHGILDGEEFVDPSIREITGDSLNHVKVTKVFHCDGLLLCVTKDKEENKTTLLVWNPYLGQTRWIQPRNYYNRLDVYAFGYDSNNREHKILRFFLDAFDVSLFEIYDICSDSWRVLDITPNWNLMFYYRGVSLKGNTYFFAKEKIVLEAGGPEEIAEPHAILLSFDFTKERFGPPLPFPFKHYTEDTGTLSSLRDEKLAALYQSSSMCDVEVWVTTKIEPDAVSWVPFLKIDLKPLTGFEFQFHHDGSSFFIDEEKKVAVIFQIDESEMTCYDTAYLIGENGHFEKVGLGESEYHQDSIPMEDYSPLVCSCSYVPSLVHINNAFVKQTNEIITSCNDSV
ncbi:putative F-box protein [Raphanus sativus]|uniref:F-box protein At3g20030 n=1 Tax=Raphanus sativus TaxID=3726 RepID=A0A9W3DQQ8_RAPSA|nr:putative F-box protein At3g20030 [Raphanus sativus]KAJ4897790.1 putative F-box protein [Raphanus sativus]